MKQLILGGARSGKSRYAENQALQFGRQWYYLATGQGGDAEMQARIAKHQQQRDKRWQLLEEPVNIAAVLQQYNQRDNTVLIDCLTLWLGNCQHHHCWHEQREQLLAAVSTFKGQLFLVSNEVGSGVVPLGELSREFVDESGCLHQSLAEICERVTLVVAGLPLDLKN